MRSAYVVVTANRTDVSGPTSEVSFEFPTPNADPRFESVLLLDRRNVINPLAMELNGVPIDNGVRENNSDEFHGQTTIVRKGSLRNGDQENVLTIRTSLVLVASQVDNIVLMYTASPLTSQL
jgi:hypothetical protein